MGEANWMYWIAIVLIIIFIIFDKTINKHLRLRKIKKLENASKVERRVNADAKLKELEDRREFYTDTEYKRRRSILEKAREDNL